MLSDIELNRKKSHLSSKWLKKPLCRFANHDYPFNILNYTTHHACAMFDNGFALLWFCFGIIYFVINVSWQCN